MFSTACSRRKRRCIHAPRRLSPFATPSFGERDLREARPPEEIARLDAELAAARDETLETDYPAHEQTKSDAREAEI